jgi:hypothetical protein
VALTKSLSSQFKHLLFKSMAEDDVQLGFLQTSDPAWFDARFFPSKAGGKPVRDREFL